MTVSNFARFQAAFGLALSVGLVSAALTFDSADARGRARVKRGAAAAPVAKSVVPAAPAAKPAEPFPETATAKPELIVGDLRASLSAAEAGTVLPVGSSAIVTLAIDAAGGNRTATVLAEAEGGEILFMSSGRLRAEKANGGMSMEIPLAAKGTTVSIEMGLKGGTRGADGKSRNRMRVTVLPQKGGKDESVFSWGLADCAGDYYAELQKIDAAKAPVMIPTLEAAVAPLPGHAGKWIFSTPIASPLLICKGPKGQKIAACTGVVEVKNKNSKQPVADPATWDDKQVLQYASDIVANKGAVPGFQKRVQPQRQMAFTLIGNLRGYMEQSAHPALCTGVDQMVTYYNERTPNLRNGIAEARAVVPVAQKLAAAKVAELGPATAANGSAGSGVISVAVAAEPVGGSPEGDMADRVGSVILSATDATETAAIKDVKAKLEHIRALLDAETTATLAEDKRTAAVAALRQIEAAFYISSIAKRYTDLEEVVYGTMRSIADAHKAKCVCQ
jgi:hypothetical protein